MISQGVKEIYFGATRWLTLPNYLAARVRYRNPPVEGLSLHLGCGEEYIPGMVNVDVNFLRRKDLWLDLCNGLPFPDGSASFVYCSHTIEHLYPWTALAVLSEIRRVLRADGVARIAVPSLEHALRIIAGDSRSEWPRNFSDPRAQALNYLFCEGQHKYGYCTSILADFARQAGFTTAVEDAVYSGEKRKQYGRVTIGNEPEGSLVMEMRR